MYTLQYNYDVPIKVSIWEPCVREPTTLPLWYTNFTFLLFYHLFYFLMFHIFYIHTNIVKTIVHDGPIFSPIDSTPNFNEFKKKDHRSWMNINDFISF